MKATFYAFMKAQIMAPYIFNVQDAMKDKKEYFSS